MIPDVLVVNYVLCAGSTILELNKMPHFKCVMIHVIHFSRSWPYFACLRVKNNFLELGENMFSICEPLQIGHMRLHLLHHLLTLRGIAHIEHLLYNIIRELILKLFYISTLSNS